jgi:hypothetical protein
LAAETAASPPQDHDAKCGFACHTLPATAIAVTPARMALISGIERLIVPLRLDARKREL